jgi:hypothetical protein
MTFQARGGAKILRGGAKQSQGRCAPPPKIRPWFRVRNFYQSCEVLAFTRFCNALYTFLQPYPPSFETINAWFLCRNHCVHKELVSFLLVYTQYQATVGDNKLLQIS